MYPYNVPRSGLLSFFKGASFGSLLDGAQKTLGVVNQTIPLIYQIKPMISNAKTMFKIADVIKSDDKETTTSISSNISENKPVFYM